MLSLRSNGRDDRILFYNRILIIKPYRGYIKRISRITLLTSFFLLYGIIRTNRRTIIIFNIKRIKTQIIKTRIHNKVIIRIVSIAANIITASRNSLIKTLSKVIL